MKLSASSSSRRRSSSSNYCYYYYYYDDYYYDDIRRLRLEALKATRQALSPSREAKVSGGKDGRMAGGRGQVFRKRKKPCLETG